MSAKDPEPRKAPRGQETPSARAPINAELAIAVRRQIAIANYHAAELQAAIPLSHGPDPDGLVVSIPVQAHFEGVLHSVDAARDKAAAYVAQTRDKSRDAAFRGWAAASLVDDARLLRNLAAHYFYEKTAITGITVDRPRRSTYDGSRDILQYCDALIDSCAALSAILFGEPR